MNYNIIVIKVTCFDSWLCIFSECFFFCLTTSELHRSNLKVVQARIDKLGVYEVGTIFSLVSKVINLFYFMERSPLLVLIAWCKVSARLSKSSQVMPSIVLIPYIVLVLFYRTFKSVLENRLVMLYNVHESLNWKKTKHLKYMKHF